jgi:hypothetical protein
MLDDIITEISTLKFRRTPLTDRCPHVCHPKLRFPDVDGVAGEELNVCESGISITIPYIGNMIFPTYGFRDLLFYPIPEAILVDVIRVDVGGGIHASYVVDAVGLNRWELISIDDGQAHTVADEDRAAADALHRLPAQLCQSPS